MKEHQTDSPKSTDDSLPLPGFRVNRQVVAIFVLSLLALAVPMTILSIGLVRMSRPSSAPLVKQPAPEAPGLRAILEKIADDKLPAASLADDRGQFVIFGKPETRLQDRKRIEDTAKSLGGTVLNDNPQDEAVLTVQIPAEAANRFQMTALSNAKVLKEPSLKNQRILYQIRFVP